MSSPEFLLLQAALAGRYSLERELGRGGMGIVFLARDVALERPVAIKLLPPIMAMDPGLRARFLLEARTAARLGHPHIVPIHAVEELGDLVCFVMAYVPGLTLAERVRAEGPMSPADVARLVREVAWALAYAHQQGVVHRDVKPENILLERGSGRALITDFGIALVASDGTRTPAGATRGTIRYMSPEQAQGQAVDGRSDLYSLGVTAFYALTGRVPFESDHPAALLLQQATALPPPVAVIRADAPPALAAVIDRCLARAPEDRFATAEALAEALGQVQEAVTTPAVLQRLSREISGIGVDIAGFGSLALVAVLVQSVTSDFFGFGRMYTLGLCALMAGLTAIRSLAAVRLMRETAREGWELPDLEAAVQREARSEAAGVSPLAPRARFGIWLLMMIGITLLWLGPKQWAQANIDGVLPWLIELFCLGAPVAAGRWLGAGLESRRDGRIGPMSRFFLRFKAGLLLRLAGLGRAKAVRPSALPDQPTEILLADQARKLLAALPSAGREQVKGASALLERLGHDAAGLRQRLEEIDAAAAAIGAAGSEAREQAREEIAEARRDIAARLNLTMQGLEQLRLDLLRAKAGVAGGEGLTEDLEALARISERVDAGK
jgi:serine/threonine-protein kinase